MVATEGGTQPQGLNAALFHAQLQSTALDSDGCRSRKGRKKRKFTPAAVNEGSPRGFSAADSGTPGLPWAAAVIVFLQAVVIKSSLPAPCQSQRSTHLSSFSLQDLRAPLNSEQSWNRPPVGVARAWEGTVAEGLNHGGSASLNKA